MATHANRFDSARESKRQPAHSPELQPAEHLWAFVDEPLANCYFATIESLDQAVSDRCVALVQWPCQRAKK